MGTTVLSDMVLTHSRNCCYSRGATDHMITSDTSQQVEVVLPVSFYLVLNMVCFRHCRSMNCKCLFMELLSLKCPDEDFFLHC